MGQHEHLTARAPTYFAWQGVKRPALTQHKQMLWQGRLQAGVKPAVPLGRRLLSGCKVEAMALQPAFLAVETGNPATATTR